MTSWSSQVSDEEQDQRSNSIVCGQTGVLINLILKDYCMRKPNQEIGNWSDKIRALFVLHLQTSGLKAGSDISLRWAFLINTTQRAQLCLGSASLSLFWKDMVWSCSWSGIGNFHGLDLILVLVLVLVWPCLVFPLFSVLALGLCISFGYFSWSWSDLDVSICQVFVLNLVLLKP